VSERQQLSADRAADGGVKYLSAEKRGEEAHFQGSNEQPIVRQAQDVFGALRDLDLLPHVAELDVLGLAVIPPEKVGIDVIAAREAVLDVAERRHGERPDWQGNQDRTSPTPFGAIMFCIGLEHPAFVPVMLNRTIEAIATQQLGANHVLSAFQGVTKPKGGQELDLHLDELYAPSPYAVHNDAINVTIPLTDYTMDNGPLAYVPGSHKLMRRPVGREGYDQRVPVTAKAGSLIIWPRHTWHGAYVGTAPGMRVNIISVFSRPHMRTLEDFGGQVTEDALEAHGPRFRQLMGKNLSYGWRGEGPVLDGSETLIGATPFV